VKLVLAVRDNGPGPGTAPVAEGVGLRNTRARLEQLYGSAQSLTSRARDGGGFEVQIVLPFHTEEDLRSPGVVAGTSPL